MREREIHLLISFLLSSGSSGLFGESGGSDDMFSAPKKAVS